MEKYPPEQALNPSFQQEAAVCRHELQRAAGGKEPGARTGALADAPRRVAVGILWARPQPHPQRAALHRRACSGPRAPGVTARL